MNTIQLNALIPGQAYTFDDLDVNRFHYKRMTIVRQINHLVFQMNDYHYGSQEPTPYAVKLDLFQHTSSLPTANSILKEYGGMDPEEIPVDEWLVQYLDVVHHRYFTRQGIVGTATSAGIELDVERKYYPLSHPQKRVWYTEKIFPDTSLFNIGGTVRIYEHWDAELLKQAIQLFIRRHDAIRIQYAEQQSDVHQYVVDDVAEIEVKSFPSETTFQQWAEKAFRTPFQLADQPLYQFTVFQVEQSCGYLVRYHHSICDGWSIQLMIDQIYDLYRNLAAGEAIAHEAGPSYLKILRKEKQYFESDRLETDKAFWSEYLKHPPIAFLKQELHDLSGDRKRFYLDEARSQALKACSQDMKVSLNTMFTAFMSVYLFKLSGFDDILLNVPVLGRSGQVEKATFGMSTSSMLFRSQLQMEQSLMDVIKQTNERLRQCMKHQRYPYDLLIKDLGLHQSAHTNPLKYAINYYNTSFNNDSETIEYYSGYQLNALQLAIKEWNQFELQMDYRLEDFSHADIERLYSYLVYVIDQTILAPHQTLQELLEGRPV
ncbi:hypothetical protein B5M42_010365 [Paenibacillus athensensis]|nr:condensation domain-containing protein [Paenibacillus athensensis]MCD1259240.1 hypothetical protein [Paenibacillus athensensis]